jgi:hypothetical protein
MTERTHKFMQKMRAMSLDEFAKLRRLEQRKILDNYWSALVRTRDKWKCRMRGRDRITCTEIMQGAHIITRAAFSIRHELWNGVCLCTGHHVWYTNAPAEWEYVVRKFFKDEYDFSEMLKWVHVELKIDYFVTLVYLQEQHALITGGIPDAIQNCKARNAVVPPEVGTQEHDPTNAPG